MTNITTLDVVISRYIRNTDWSEKFKSICPQCEIKIYDKEKPENPYNVPINKGNEASTYLKYILDNYDNLPEYVFFCHDEEFAWHHSGSIIDHFKLAIESKQKYYNVNDKIYMGDIRNNEYGFQSIRDWYSDFIEEYIPFEHLPDPNWTQGYRGSAQFLVHKEYILNLPKKFYGKIYFWILTTRIPSAASGRFLEWTWHIFWSIYPELILTKKNA